MMRFIIFLFLVLPSLHVNAQHFHLDELRHCYHEPSKKTVYSFAKGNTNEIQTIFSSLFLFYKFAISSQDYNSCTFHPSCSEYGLLAVKKKGAFAGMLATIDRLQRCNGLSPNLYEIDVEKRLLIDFP